MIWLGDSYYLVTTGYSKQSNREIILRDIRNINNIVYTITADNVLSYSSIHSIESWPLHSIL